MKINWAKKLSSRKFWTALAALIGAVLAVFKLPTETVTQVTAIVSAAGVLAAYILCEGYVDAKAAGAAAAKEGGTDNEDNRD